MNFSTLGITLAASFGLGLLAGNAAEAAPINKKLVTSFVKTKGASAGKTVYCYLKNGKYLGAKKQGSKFVANSKSDKSCKGLKAIKSKLCLSKIPSITSSDSSSLRFPVTGAAVSGTAPLLLDIMAGNPNIAEIIFSDDTLAQITAGTASPQQCGNFWGANIDGGAAGIVTAYSIQSAGYSFENMVRAGTTMCYMKNFPTAENLEAGAVEVIAGDLPPGGIESIFTPGGQSRTVKVAVSGGEEGPGQTIFIRIPSVGSNASAGDAFNAQLWFCSDEIGVNGVETIKIKYSGEYTAKSIGVDPDFSHETTFHAFLRNVSGNLVFDTTRDRVAEIEADSSGGNFKANLRLTSDNFMRISERNDFGSVRSAYSVMGLSGSTLADLRINQGATKEGGDNVREPFAFEWRDSSYVSAPDSDLLEQLDQVDFDADFFQDAASPDADVSSYSCEAEADLELALDMSSSNMQDVAVECEGARIENGDIVNSSEEIQNAMNNYGSCE